MKDKYKHLLNFTANIISLAVEAAMFGWVWYMLYIPMLDKANTFFNRGNWAVIGMYVLFVFFFTKIFGGYRIGYMRISDIILSQILAVILAMIVAYFEICLVANESSSEISFGCAIRFARVPRDILGSFGASTSVFHAPHAGHCPIHFAVSLPHSEQ